MPPPRKNPKKPTGNPDELVGRTGARQWGAVTGAQARKKGMSQHQIDHRVRTKRWRREARDVFVLAGTRNTWQQQAMVACLAGPAGTVVSHLTAAAVYGLVKAPKEPQVTIPRNGNGERLRGVRVRRADLGPGQKAERQRLPCTSPIQTVIDVPSSWTTSRCAIWLTAPCAASSCSQAG
jgi:hypothetical protein